MCGHHSVPPEGLAYQAMVKLTPGESGHTLVFYHIAPEPGGSVVVDAALVEAAAVSRIPLLSARLDVVAAVPPGVKEIINARSACWSLGLLRRDTILNARANFYTVGSKLGKGSHGDVFTLTFHDDVTAKLCGKLIRTDNVDQLKTRMEVYALERCNDHPSGIVRLLDVFVRRHNSTDQVYLVMELWEKDLYAFLAHETPTPIQIRSALQGPLEGLRFLHEHLHLVHCDVKSKNILVRVNLAAAVPDITAVLGDLGSVMEVCI